MGKRGSGAGRAAAGITVAAALGLGPVLAWAQGAQNAAPAQPAKPDPKALEFFESRVRPLLAQQCFACHGEKLKKGGLRLDTAAEFLKGGDSGKLVEPGHPEKSLLIDAVNYTKDHLKMPPAGKLKPQQIADLTEWVRMGAPWPNAPVTPAAPEKPGGPLFTAEQKQFWAFRPVKAPAVPAVKNQAWVRNPVDAFVLQKLEARGLKPAPKADRLTLLRRVSFDLTGLPPTPEEVDAFLADQSPGAWEKVVDRLLASPAYGERWGRHWLDVARYADSNGLDENTAFANAWRYRDYVIKSLNDDKPYDQFVKEQLAGDLLPASGDEAANRERLVATGFLVLGPKVLAEPDKEKMVMDIVDEQIDTMGKAFMGLTLGCSRCHDHKFDPVPTKDYYSLAGIFKSTRTMETLATVARAYERPLADAETLKKQEQHQQQVQAKEAAVKAESHRLLAEASGGIVGQLDRYLLVGLRADVAPLRQPGAPDLGRAGTILLEAEKFARGDVQVSTTGYGEGIGIIESAGRNAAFVEYDVELPADGEYELALRYASGQVRPVKVSLDGAVLKEAAAAKPTGGFDPTDQQWAGETVFTAKAGKHVLRVEQGPGHLPHLDKIALVPAQAAAPALNERRPRGEKPEALAQAHGLNAEVLRRSAAYLLASKERGGDRIWEPWHLLSELPEESFADGARKMVTEWQASGRLMAWLPPVAQAFSGEAPRSLEEAAARYKALFTRANQAWLNQVKSAQKPPQRLGDGDLETLRQVLYGANGGFLLDRAERFYPAEAAGKLKVLREELAALQKAPAPAVPMALAVEEAKQVGNVRVHIRGNTQTLGDEVPRQFLRIVAGEDQKPLPAERSGRLELAEWLTSPQQPLTSRVMANRVWLHHFGEGIVRSPDNFGKLGEKPTHPELLDYLASSFVKNGWSLKKLHRLILLSNTYQMSTAYDAKAALADPENRLLWRFHRRRLEVEAIRDSILSVAGTLDRKMGGSLLQTPNFAYVTNDQSSNQAQYDAPRRSIYLPVIRNAVYDVFQVFDFVEPSFLNGKRASTTVAPQALFLMNGQFVMNQARAFAQSLLAAPEADDAARLRLAYRRAYGRAPDAAESASALEFLKGYEERLAAKEQDPAKRRLAAWQAYCQILFSSNEFLYTN